MTGARSSSRRWALLGAVGLLAGGIAFGLGSGLGRDPETASSASSALVRKPAPALAGPTLDGGEFQLRDYRGKWVLVNVWASWCDACRKEHPVLAEAARELGPRGLRVVGINMKDAPDDARRFIEEMGGAYGPSVLDRDGRIAVRWGTYALPETYLVNPQGLIVAKRTGAVTPRWVQSHVTPRLGEAQ